MFRVSSIFKWVQRLMIRAPATREPRPVVDFSLRADLFSISASSKADTDLAFTVGL
jgi:hypothetical protein